MADVKLEDDKFGGVFFAYIHAMWHHIKRYGPKWHNLTSSGSQISILQVRGPNGTSGQVRGPLVYLTLLFMSVILPEES